MAQCNKTCWPAWLPCKYLLVEGWDQYLCSEESLYLHLYAIHHIFSPAPTCLFYTVESVLVMTSHLIYVPVLLPCWLSICLHTLFCFSLAYWNLYNCTWLIKCLFGQCDHLPISQSQNPKRVHDHALHHHFVFTDAITRANSFTNNYVINFRETQHSPTSNSGYFKYGPRALFLWYMILSNIFVMFFVT